MKGLLKNPNILKRRFRIWIFYASAFLFFSFGSSSGFAQQVLISEFVAMNGGSLVDGEGDEPDWIELQNVGYSTVDLTGWYLTDDADDLNKWMFPATSIGPGEYLVVFASNKNKIDAAGGLHTNFKLSGDGGYLALVRPDLTVEHEYTPEYPPQYPDVSYGVSVIGSTTEILISSGAQASYRVPSSSADDVNTSASPWNAPEFDDSVWTTTDLGVGYASAAGDAYDAFIGPNGEVEHLMSGINATVYIRIPFVVDDPSRITALTLWARYDDGFAAYINGGTTTVASANNPSDASLAYNSSGTAGHPDGNAVNLIPFNIDLSGVTLVTGTNVLAVHGLNRAAVNSDFLFDGTLDASIAAANSVSVPVFMTTPTPGESNAGGVASLGPIIRDVTDSALALNLSIETERIIDARIEAADAPVTGVTLYHRKMFGSETTVAMSNAGDGTYNATIPLAGMSAGEMLRWRIEAVDSNGKVSHAPLFNDPLNSPEYYGTIANDPAITSQLPTIHWFVENESAADTDAGARASAWFRDEFYDNILARRRGGSTSSLPKKSYKFDFNSRAHFRFDPDAGRAEEINLNQTWSDKSYIRQSLSFEMYDRCGSPGSESFLVRLHRNGLFHSLNAFIEQPDKRLLKREGLDDRGALYKMYNTFAASGVKKNRTYEGSNDLSTFVAAIKDTSGTELDQNIFDQVDVPRQLNYLVATVLAQSNDNMAKNYYLYRDSDGSGEWFQIAWDTDLTWGRHFMNGGNSGDGMWADVDYRTYSSESYISPSHPFTGCAELQANRSWNRLIDKLYENPRFAEMYRRRLRTVMDDLFAPPVLENRIAELEAQFTLDAVEDTAKWGQYGTSQTLAESLDVLKEGYLNPKRTHLFDTHSVHHAGSYPTYPDPDVVSAELPDAQPTNAIVSICAVDYNPASGIQDEEYICITNANDYAVDVSGWKLSGGVSHTIRLGTVILSGEALHLTPSSLAFRARAIAPHGGLGLLVQGGYEGHLNARGEDLFLTDNTGRLVSSHTYSGTPSPVQEYLRITEVMYNPAPDALLNSDAQNYEYIELRNISPDTTLDLTGVHFSQGIEFDFTGGSVTTLLPGEYVLVVRDEAAFAARYGPGLPLAGTYLGTLDNGGETLRLDDAAGEKILEFSYNNAWYPISDGLGFSLTVIDDAANWFLWDEKSSWRISGALNGSPGTACSIPVITPVLVNEVLAHTDLPMIDAVELYNPAPVSKDIGGWFITDDFYMPWKYRIPDGTSIPAGGYRVFDEGQFNVGTNAFLLSEHGDSAYLFEADSSSNLTGYVHGWDFNASPNGVAFGRHVDSQGVDHFVPQSTNTLGSVNALPLVGPIVVSEIMYHPPEQLGGVDNSADEFVELLNISGVDVSLYCTDTGVPGYGDAALTNTWKLRNAVDYDFPTNTILVAGTRLLVVGFNPSIDVTQLTNFRTLYDVPGTVPIFGPWVGKLDNSSEQVELKRPGAPEPIAPFFVPYIMVEEIDYSHADPWAIAADGFGPSLQRRTPSSFANDPINWRAAYPRNATAPDTDSDGMADWWEEYHGLLVGLNDAHLDPDVDGLGNAHEESAGTDPQDGDSTLHLGSNGATFGFDAAADVQYTVQFKGVLTTNSWQNWMQVDAGSTNRFILITPTMPESRHGFFRVVTPPMP